jgi:hypothetical protein
MFPGSRRTFPGSHLAATCSICRPKYARQDLDKAIKIKEMMSDVSKAQVQTRKPKP